MTTAKRASLHTLFPARQFELADLRLIHNWPVSFDCASSSALAYRLGFKLACAFARGYAVDCSSPHPMNSLWHENGGAPAIVGQGTAARSNNSEPDAPFAQALTVALALSRRIA
jgi:hypothetical protein